MKPEESYLLITRYLARQTSAEENDQLATWVAGSPENEQTFEQLKTVWQHSQTPPTPAATAAALHRLKVRPELASQAPQPAAPLPQLRPKAIRRYRVALGVLLVVVLAGAGIFFYLPTPSAPAYHLTRTAAGQQQTLRLPDGSRVTLAPQSQLRYPTQFATGNREVYLEGEAFFEVSKNPHRPFRVHSGALVTRVLGTRFNVQARPGADQVAVSLVEGRVEVLDQQTTYQLAPGQQLLADRRTGRMYRQPFSPDRVTGWRQRQLIFQNEKLTDVADQIERLYGVKLVFADTATANVRLWATFRNEPLPQVLAALQEAGPIAYRREGYIIYLSTTPELPDH
ncbi:FecR domain-containing protein [Hymenobacter aerilatus]|uniref:FecR domain-containing protein n=1 Tax=Hymenobacter aerilatus TaxID=2932251 RepID=A0A8T9SS80_9BACT|nr:FecR domain-containing protein [Hymenobacter aerilatus]UOR04972.1 FecR domain-containing protein [Hymenobacter aerilatus]